mgnify:CR=1 FL=1
MISARVEENGRIKILQTTVSDSVLFEQIGFDFPKSWNGYTKTRRIYKRRNNGERGS